MIPSSSSTVKGILEERKKKQWAWYCVLECHEFQRIIHLRSLTVFWPALCDYTVKRCHANLLGKISYMKWWNHFACANYYYSFEQRTNSIFMNDNRKLMRFFSVAFLCSFLLTKYKYWLYDFRLRLQCLPLFMGIQFV